MQENVEVKEIEIIEDIKETKKTKKKSWFKRSVIVLLLLLMLFGVYRYVRNIDKSKIDNVSGYMVGSGFSPGLSFEELQSMLQKEIDASKVAFSVYTRPVFKGKKGIIMFANPRYSAHDLTLEVKENEKIIIKTNKISPNQYIEEIEMLERLDKGEHKTDARIKAYDRNTGELVGEVAVDMIITVK